MTLNVSPEQNNAAGDERDSAAPERQAILDELLEEMTGWTSRERMGMFKHWHEGSLSLIHLHVLTMLEVEGPLAMSRLADALDVSVASVTGIVDRMERRGFVERRHDTEDRRVVLVHLTDRGAAVFRALAVDRRLRLARLLGQLDEEELAGFLKGLRAMRAARARLFETHAHAGSDAIAPAAAEDGHAGDGPAPTV